MHGKIQQGKQLVKEFKQEISVPNSQAPPYVVKACSFIIKKLDHPKTTVAAIKEQFGIQRRSFTIDFKGTPILPQEIL